MPDSAIQVTPGSGTNVDTRTESTFGNHRQVIVVGDGSDNNGIAPVDATAGLKVDLGADNDVTVSGTVTLDAGNTASLTNIKANTDPITDALAGEYELVAASQTNQTLGATGAFGDYLASLLVIPTTTSPGAISIKDGADSAIQIFAGGADSLSNLVPFLIPIGIYARTGAWQITTGSGVSVLAAGNFT